MRDIDRSLLQSNALLVGRHAIEVRPVQAGEGFEISECIFVVEYLNVAFQCERGIENACAATVAFLVVTVVRRTVGTEKVFRRSTCRSSAQRQPVLLALRHGQTIHMRAYPPDQNVVAIDVEVLRRDRRSDIGARAFDETHRLHGSDVFEDHLQLRQPVHQRLEHAVDEDRLPVEDIDVRGGHFAMNA